MQRGREAHRSFMTEIGSIESNTIEIAFSPLFCLFSTQTPLWSNIQRVDGLVLSTNDTLAYLQINLDMR